MKITVAVPAHNEENIIGESASKLHGACASFWGGEEWKIVIAENGSSDLTLAKALEAGRVLPNLSAVSLPSAGKGGAIRQVWEKHPADVYMFFDADLSADPDAARICAEQILLGADVVAPSRFNPASKTKRRFLRKAVSWGYRILLFLFFRPPVSDLPCGVKAVSPKVVAQILPKIKSDGFFFDSELVLRAARAGLRVVEIPVVWNDAKKIGRRSRVPLWQTARSYLKAMRELKKEF